MGNLSNSSGTEPPLSITHFSHPHPLQLFTAETWFNCDICRGLGSNTRYRCAACDFDAHWTCLNPAQQQQQQPNMVTRSTVPMTQPPMINPYAPNIIHGTYRPPPPPQPAAAYPGQGVGTQLWLMAAHEVLHNGVGLLTHAISDGLHHHQQHHHHVMGMDGGGGGGGDGDYDGGHSHTSQDRSYDSDPYDDDDLY